MILARKIESVAFDRPGGEYCPMAQTRPIDLEHLSEQTFGDRALAEEVLKLFCTQMQQAGSSLRQASAEERQFLAHALKGSARGIGAAALASAAERVEQDSMDDGSLDELFSAMESVRIFCASIFR